MFWRLVAPALLALAATLAPRARAESAIDLQQLSVEGGVLTAGRADGSRVRLSLYPALQERVARILEGSRAPAGALVMADVHTGALLAYKSVGSREDLVRTPRYPPASLLKVVTAAALLESEHVFRSTPQCFGGGLRGLEYADVALLCRPGEPKVPFGQALGRSINVVFGRLAFHHLSGPELAGMSRRLGWGEPPPIDIAAPPSRIDWPASGLPLARAAAGFTREAALSPLSALSMMHIVANRGVRVRLRVIGDRVEREELDRPLRAATANALARMLAVTTESGTSRRAFRDRPGRPRYHAAGKTGSLTVGPPARFLSWFAGFAPAREPRVAIVVMLANSPRWWRKSNEVARDALDAYFEQMAAEAG